MENKVVINIKLIIIIKAVLSLLIAATAAILGHFLSKNNSLQDFLLLFVTAFIVSGIIFFLTPDKKVFGKITRKKSITSGRFLRALISTLICVPLCTLITSTAAYKTSDTDLHSQIENLEILYSEAEAEYNEAVANSESDEEIRSLMGKMSGIEMRIEAVESDLKPFIFIFGLDFIITFAVAFVLIFVADITYFSFDYSEEKEKNMP